MKKIPGYNGYHITKTGEVWSTKYNKLTKRSPRLTKGGYSQLILFKFGKLKNEIISRLVLLTFVGPCPKGMECCHNDGNNKNNNLSNLRWDTPKNNHADRKKHGTIIYGENNPKAKLNEFQIRIIRKYPKYIGSGIHLSEFFEVHPAHISRIRNKKRRIIK